MGRPQYSLRAILLATTGIAVLLFFVTNLRITEVTIDAVCYGVPCAALGAVVGRFTGRDRIDAAIAAVCAFLVGAAFPFLLPKVY